ncbi:MAG: barstar family protein [Clostridia bacterium]|nr:barstar family protein [Clostridia bacterium]
MKIVLLDGEKIKSAADMHRAFKKALRFPDWYGNNLDALSDMLTESTDEIGVILVNTDKLAESLGWRWEMLLRLLVELKRERPNFKVSFEPFREGPEE